MYVTRGDALADQNDLSGAYVAYRQAYNYDPGNEIAKFKMERMLELQKARLSGTAEQVKYNTRTGNIKPASNEIQLAASPAPGTTLRWTSPSRTPRSSTRSSRWRSLSG